MSVDEVRKNQVVAITFHDHAEDDEPLKFVAYGRVSAVGRRFITIMCWTYPKGSHKSRHDHNVDSYSIVKSAIIDVTLLVPAL